MRIGYDAKRIFHNNTGLGNYGRDLIHVLNNSPLIEQFFLFNTKEPKDQKKIPKSKTTVVYPKGWFWKAFPSIWRLLGQWKQINGYKLDFYHGLSGELPIQFKNQKIKTLVTVHDLIFLSHPKFYNYWDRVIYKLKFKYAVNKAHHVVAISEQTKRDIVKYFGISPERISVIYQGCNQAYKITYSKEEKLRVCKKYGLPKDFILNVGTIQERKNVLVLIKAIKQTDFHVVLVGKEKKYAKEIKNFISLNNLEGQVHFISNIRVQDLAILYQIATLFCYPSLCEGFGIPIIEAMYSKLPVLVTKDGCFPEAAGPHSVYIDPNNPQEIREKLNILFKNPELREKMAEEGLKYVQRFSDEIVAKNLLQLYKSVLQ